MAIDKEIDFNDLVAPIQEASYNAIIDGFNNGLHKASGNISKQKIKIGTDITVEADAIYEKASKSIKKQEKKINSDIDKLRTRLSKAKPSSSLAPSKLKENRYKNVDTNLTDEDYAKIEERISYLYRNKGETDKSYNSRQNKLKQLLEQQQKLKKFETEIASYVKDFNITDETSSDQLVKYYKSLLDLVEIRKKLGKQKGKFGFNPEKKLSNFDEQKEEIIKLVSGDNIQKSLTKQKKQEETEFKQRIKDALSSSDKETSESAQNVQKSIDDVTTSVKELKEESSNVDINNVNDSLKNVSKYAVDAQTAFVRLNEIWDSFNTGNKSEFGDIEEFIGYATRLSNLTENAASPDVFNFELTDEQLDAVWKWEEEYSSIIKEINQLPVSNQTNELNIDGNDISHTTSKTEELSDAIKEAIKLLDSIDNTDSIENITKQLKEATEKFQESNEQAKKLIEIKNAFNAPFITEKDGNKPLIGYRGTNGSHSGTISDADEITFYTTDEEVARKEYAKNGKVTKANFAMLKPLEVDVGGQHWDDITWLGNGLTEESRNLQKLDAQITKYEEKLKSLKDGSKEFIEIQTKMNLAIEQENKILNDPSKPYVKNGDTDSWAKKLKENQLYDGMILSNIIDGQDRPSTDIISFNQYQIRNAEVLSDVTEKTTQAIEEQAEAQTKLNNAISEANQNSNTLPDSSEVEAVSKSYDLLYEKVKKVYEIGESAQKFTTKEPNNYIIDEYGDSSYLKKEDVLDDIKSKWDEINEEKRSYNGNKITKNGFEGSDWFRIYGDQYIQLVALYEKLGGSVEDLNKTQQKAANTGLVNAKEELETAIKLKIAYDDEAAALEEINAQKEKEFNSAVDDISETFGENYFKNFFLLDFVKSKNNSTDAFYDTLGLAKYYGIAIPDAVQKSVDAIRSLNDAVDDKGYRIYKGTKLSDDIHEIKQEIIDGTLSTSEALDKYNDALKNAFDRGELLGDFGDQIKEFKEISIQPDNDGIISEARQAIDAEKELQNAVKDTKESVELFQESSGQLAFVDGIENAIEAEQKLHDAVKETSDVIEGQMSLSNYTQNKSQVDEDTKLVVKETEELEKNTEAKKENYNLSPTSDSSLGKITDDVKESNEQYEEAIRLIKEYVDLLNSVNIEDFSKILKANDILQSLGLSHGNISDFDKNSIFNFAAQNNPQKIFDYLKNNAGFKQQDSDLSSSAKETANNIGLEDTSAKEASESMEKLAASKKKARQANSDLSSSAKETSDSLDKEGQAAKEASDAVDQLNLKDVSNLLNFDMSKNTNDFKKQVADARNELIQCNDIIEKIKSGEVVDDGDLKKLQKATTYLKELYNNRNDKRNVLAKDTQATNLYRRMADYTKYSGMTGSQKTELEGLINELKNLQDTGNLSGEALDNLRSKLNLFDASLSLSENKVKSFFDRFKTSFIAQTAADLARMYLGTMDFIRYGKEAAKIVTDINSSQIELRKVSDASESDLTAYWDQAAESAKKYGSAIDDVINSTADWSRWTLACLYREVYEQILSKRGNSRDGQSRG